MRKSNLCRTHYTQYDEDGLEQITLLTPSVEVNRVEELLRKARKRVSQSNKKVALPNKTNTAVSVREAFLTDVDVSQQEIHEYQMAGPEPDNNLMLRDMVRLQTDPLAELRVMISNTNKRLTGYGNETNNLKLKVKEAIDEKRLTLGNGFSQRPSTSYNSRRRSGFP